jgi:dipeptidyl aminopeptidase/acylaminoacyl peptidase
MLSRFFKSVIAIAAFVSLCACDDANKENKMQNDKLIPRSVLFGNPDKIGVSVSPDAKHISYVAPLDGVLNVYVAPINDLKNAKPITADKGRGITNYAWSYDGQNILYMQDKDGDENHSVYRVNLSTNDVLRLTPEGVKAMIIKGSPRHEDELLIAMNDRDPRFFDVHRFNIWTGESKMIFDNSSGYAHFLADDALDIRFATKSLDDGSEKIDQFVGVGDAVEFKVVPFEDTSNTGLLAIDSIGNTLYMFDSQGRDTAALYSIDLHTYEKQVIAETDKADIDGVDFEPKTKKIQSYSYTYEKQKTTVIDPAIEKDIKYLEALDDGEMNITSRSYEDNMWVVSYMKDNAPVSYYLYDRAKGKAEFMFVHNSRIADVKLNKMNPVVIDARDGVKMVSYLTFPKSAGKIADSLKPEHATPLVLYVHGGPEARDDWGYNSIHQWLSDRGYAVLSVNYRGSAGFGKNFVRMGDGQWSRKMHEDLLDAVNWAVSNGVTTKDQVAIFGGSYGGYATLVGLTITPETFACGVDIVGPSNLATLYDSIPPYWEPFKVSLSKKMGGDTSNETAMQELRARSPINYVDSIKKPLLIAQGANDPRVKQAESDQIVDAMKAKGIPVTYLLYPDEGHGFVRPDNKQSFYAVAEHFLGSCLKGAVEPVGDDMNNTSMQILHGEEYLHLSQ